MLAQHNIHLLAAFQLRVGRFLGALLVAALLVFVNGCRSEKVSAPAKLTPEQERGRRLFAASCQVCHETQTAAARQGPSLQGIYQKPWLPSGAPANDDRVRDAIVMGRPNMPGFQYVLTDEQVKDLIAYLRTL
jgi:mono/diheme cytochrome c family protein